MEFKVESPGLLDFRSFKVLFIFKRWGGPAPSP